MGGTAAVNSDPSGMEVFFFFFSFPAFQGRNRSLWRFPGLGVESATYTTAYSNAGSLTHWGRPGIELATSWFLVGFVSAVPLQKLPNILKFISSPGCSGENMAL